LRWLLPQRSLHKDNKLKGLGTYPI
jgi:hypothetical protein